MKQQIKEIEENLFFWINKAKVSVVTLNSDFTDTLKFVIILYFGKY